MAFFRKNDFSKYVIAARNMMDRLKTLNEHTPKFVKGGIDTLNPLQDDKGWVEGLKKFKTTLPDLKLKLDISSTVETVLEIHLKETKSPIMVFYLEGVIHIMTEAGEVFGQPLKVEVLDPRMLRAEISESVLTIRCPVLKPLESDGEVPKVWKLRVEGQKK